MILSLFCRYWWCFAVSSDDTLRNCLGLQKWVFFCNSPPVRSSYCETSPALSCFWKSIFRVWRGLLAIICFWWLIFGNINKSWLFGLYCGQPAAFPAFLTSLTFSVLCQLRVWKSWNVKCEDWVCSCTLCGSIPCISSIPSIWDMFPDWNIANCHEGLVVPLSDFHENRKGLKIPCTPLASADRVAISMNTPWTSRSLHFWGCVF